MGNIMAWRISKYLINAALVVAISVIARRSDRLGAVMAALPMFLAFPMLLNRIAFWPTLAASAVICVACFALLYKVVEPFGINLL